MQEAGSFPHRQVRLLILFSVAYLAVPNLLFLAGWLKGYLSLIFIMLVTLPWLVQWRDIRPWREDPTAPPLFTLSRLGVILLAAALWVVISGIGGYGYQDTDWLKHNALLKDLVLRPWPVTYSSGNFPTSLVYYLAYYLPAALVGKIAGWNAANLTLFLWSLGGVLLAMSWFYLLSRGSLLLGLGVFIFFSGLDVVGMRFFTPLILAVKPEYSQLVSWRHIEPWSIGWQYSSHTTQLFWVPNQALAGWIAAGLLAYTILNNLGKKYVLFYWALTLLWSPFISLGLLLLMAADLLRDLPALGQRLKAYLSLPNLCGVSLFALVGLYYIAKVYPPDPALGPGIPHGFSLSVIEGTEAKLLGLFIILVFCLLEFGLYAWLASGGLQSWSMKKQAVFLASLIWLCLLPFFRYGTMNDLAMRASIPSLFLLAIVVFQELSASSASFWRRGALLGLLLLGAVTAGIEIQRHLQGIQAAGKLVNISPVDQVAGIWEYAQRGPEALMRQYFGSSQAFFFRYLAR